VVTRQDLARRWAALVVAVMLVTIVLIARPAAGDEPPGHDHGPATTVPGVVYAPESSYRGLLPPGNWTPEQVAKARDLVARTEVALQKYDTLEEIEALGYGNFGVTAPGGWDHWGKRSLNTDSHELDPEYPETLVFRRDPDGYKLYAAMFLFPTPPYTVTNLPPEWAWLPGWHDHDGQFCTDPETGAWKSLPPCGPGTTGSHPEPMVHVWIRDIPECNNRFGGVGVGGVHCGDHGDNPIPECPPYPPYPTRCVTTGPPGTRPQYPGTRPQYPGGGTIPPPMPDRDGNHSGGSAQPPSPPATPVQAVPHYTG
jgi:hypothetical protein